MGKTRVALFAGQDVGYVMADYFSQRDDIELFVVSFQSQRDVINGYRSALTICREKGVPFIATNKPYQDARVDLARWQPDIIVGAYYARLLHPDLLKIAPRGGINVHPGILPRYRGPMPTPWYILNGEKTFGMTIFQIDDGIDTGPVFVQREYPIADDETGYGLYRRAMVVAAEMYIECFDPIIRGELIAKPQEGEPLFCPRIEARYHIDWASSRETITRHIRVHAKPYFPAYTFIYNKIMLISKSTIGNSYATPNARLGEILEVANDGRLSIACGDGNLIVENYDLFPTSTGDEWALHVKTGTLLV